MQFHSAITVLTCALGLAACQGPRPSDLTRKEQNLVAIKTVRLPTNEAWYTHFAEHSWIDMYSADERTWTRVEANVDPDVWSIPPAAAYADERWGREVELLAVVEGERAHRCLPQIREQAAAVSEGFDYRAWPGPNSNTFIARILMGVPELGAELEHNAVGKDYTPWISAGWTSARDGVRLDTLPLGLSLGYLSGVELHLFELTAGVAFWPPALKLPFLPRLGPAPGRVRQP